MRKPAGRNPAAVFSWKKEGGQIPRKPKKPCAYPGCPNLTEGRYCPEHRSKVNSEYEKYGRDPRTKKRLWIRFLSGQDRRLRYGGNLGSNEASGCLRASRFFHLGTIQAVHITVEYIM